MVKRQSLRAERKPFLCLKIIKVLFPNLCFIRIRITVIPGGKLSEIIGYHNIIDRLISEEFLIYFIQQCYIMTIEFIFFAVITYL